MEIKCPHCEEVISLDLYKKAIRQQLMSEQGKQTMSKRSKKQKSEMARRAINIRWKKHKMGGQNLEKPNSEIKTS